MKHGRNAVVGVMMVRLSLENELLSLQNEESNRPRGEALREVVVHPVDQHFRTVFVLFDEFSRHPNPFCLGYRLGDFQRVTNRPLIKCVRSTMYTVRNRTAPSKASRRP